MSGRRQDWPRFGRHEIRAFADWLDRGGWEYDGLDADGHTMWWHRHATDRYKLPCTPRHFDVQRARREVAKLLGQKVEGKRSGKAKVHAPRRDFALEQATRQARERRAEQQPRNERPVPTGPAASVPRRTPKRLPWENQPDDYDRGLAQMMQEPPGRFR